MYHSQLAEYHLTDSRKFKEDSPELMFFRHLGEGGTDVEKFFQEKTACGRDVCLYTTDKCYTGLAGIKEFAKTWLGRVNAKSATVIPVVQTIAGGRAVLEMEMAFDVGEEELYKVPLAVYADLAPHGTMEGMRIYYFHKWIPGTSPYTPPIFRPTHNEPQSLALMTGIMREYFEQLHNHNSEHALERIVNLAAEDIKVGGYKPLELHPGNIGIDAFRTKYAYTTSITPSQTFIRIETMVDDGVTCAIEWTAIARQSALHLGIVSQAGMAAYERDGNGKFKSIRICDNFRYEREIESSLLHPENNFVG